MEFLCEVLALLLVVSVSFLLHIQFFQNRSSIRLPLGDNGWPLIGENLEFLSSGWKGCPEKFFFDRMSKYSSNVFKTHLFGEKVAVLCGATANKLVFSNHDKLVGSWFPDYANKIFKSSTEASEMVSAIHLRRMLPGFIKPEALQRYVSLIDDIAQRHFRASWENRSEVIVYPLTQEFTFCVACRLFLSMEEPKQIANFWDPLASMLAGIMSIPIDFPGTPFNRAVKAGAFLRRELSRLVRQRRDDLENGNATPTQDVLSMMLLSTDENGKFLEESSVASLIIALLIGGHDTSSTACCFIVKYLAGSSEIYEQVYKEQMEIAKSKAPGESLNWNDIKKMKHSWNVACEALRMTPPLPGVFREAICDFMFNGFTIPKSWKIFVSIYSIHKNPEYFPMPEKFDPSRFEGAGPAPYTFIPFGGGPRMCPGKEYARLEILVFMHHW